MTMTVTAQEDFLVAFAIADAFCHACEYRPEGDPVCAQALEVLAHPERPFGAAGQRFLQHPRHPMPGSRWDTGRYTDDTQMSIAVAETILASDAAIPSSLDFANAFARVYHRDPRPGYSKGFQKVLERSPDGHALINNLYGRNDSTKNGAAMRALPIGVFMPSDVWKATNSHANVTHNSTAGVGAASDIAIMAGRALQPKAWAASDASSASLEAIGRAGWAMTWPLALGPPPPPVPPPAPRQGPIARVVETDNETVAAATVRAVAAILQETLSQPRPSHRYAMRRTIEVGGDTDTVGALACGLLALHGVPIEDDLAWMVAGLEPEGALYGVNYLRALGQRLVRRSQR